jgi:hypothetical protein
MVELLFGRKAPTSIRTSLQAITLDATLAEDSEYSNRITEFPLESGSSISDHVIHEPENVTIKGLISETPVAVLGTVGRALMNGGSFSDPIGDGYAFLLAIGGYSQPKFSGKAKPTDQFLSGGQDITESAQQFQLVDILTEFRLYTSMGITRLHVGREPTTGDALVFTASFKKVRMVEVQEGLTMPRVSEPAAAPRAKKQAAEKSNVGTQNASDMNNLESVIHGITFSNVKDFVFGK